MRPGHSGCSGQSQPPHRIPAVALHPSQGEGGARPRVQTSPATQGGASSIPASGKHHKDDTATVLVRQRQQGMVRAFLQHSSISRLYIEATSRGMGKSLFLQWASSACAVEGHLLLLHSRASELDQTPYYALQSLIPQLFKHLHTLHIAQVQEGGGGVGGGGDTSHDSSTSSHAQDDGVDGDGGGDGGLDSGTDWLWDPSSLSLPPALRADPTPLLLFNTICPAVHFQPTQHLSISLPSPTRPTLSPQKKLQPSQLPLKQTPPLQPLLPSTPTTLPLLPPLHLHLHHLLHPLPLVESRSRRPSQPVQSSLWCLPL